MYSVYGRDGLDVTILPVFSVAVVKIAGSANVDLFDTITGAMAHLCRGGEDATV